MRSFIVFLCLIPVLLFSCQSVSLETQLKEAIKDKKAEIGIAVIIDGKDTITVNNDTHYPLMSVFKFHQALALADYMGKRNQSLDTLLTVEKSDLKPDTYSPLRDKYPEGGKRISQALLSPFSRVIIMLVIFFFIIRAGRILRISISGHWGFRTVKSLIRKMICMRT